MSGERIAVVLMNLGGPDSPEAIRPFLFNLFNDPAIIGLPGPLRWLVAKLISARRAKVAAGIYEKIGGRSPLLDQTKRQGDCLTERLGSLGIEARSFIAMRYWHPMTREAVSSVKEWRPDRVVLLPLYPHYSRTTTGSSLAEWDEEAKRQSLNLDDVSICCYPLAEGMIEAQAELIFQALAGLDQNRVRILFSAHGLPKSVIDSGDPYQRQIEETATAIATKLGKNLDWLVCYQSRVGPMEWIGPSTDDEIRRAGKDGKSVVVVPIAFVSEHSETLVELDIEYAELAHKAGVRDYVRVPALYDHPLFMDALCGLVVDGLKGLHGECRAWGEHRRTNTYGNCGDSCLGRKSDYSRTSV